MLFALALNLALWAFLAIRYEGLGDLLPLHFDAKGFPDRIESKSGIFGLPLIGLVVLLANAGIALLAPARERAAGLLLAAAAWLVEVLLWFAALNIIGGIS